MSNGRLDVMEQVVSCTACELHEQCSAPVAFRGPTPQDVAVVGEAPGEQEDKLGKPFIGPAGKLLADELNKVGLDLDGMFVCNTVSCWPHGTPTAKHVQACAPNKWAQLELANPKWVLLLGKVAFHAERPDLELSRFRGRPFRPIEHGPIFMTTYHPAAAARNGLYRREMAGDLAKFRELTDTDNWTSLIGDTCSSCSFEWVWLDRMGVPYCPDHLTDEARDWMAANDRLTAAARSRS